MRFDRLTLRGLGPFHTQVAIDFGALPGPLVAISGLNGAGKSVLLESLAAACYRRTPTRGTLGELATARDAFCEVQITNGSSYLLRQTVDAHTGKGESLIVDAETGAPIVESGKRRDADRWVAEHLPLPEVLYSSTFGAQGKGGFLDLDPAERKRVILRVLGHEHLEELARLAGERARAALGALDTCLARLKDEQQRGEDLATADEALATARNELALAETALGAARRALAALQAQAAAGEAERLRFVERAAALESLASERDRAGKALADLEKRRDNNSAVLADGAAIRSAAAELPALEQAAAKLRDEAAAAQRAQQEALQSAVHERQLGGQAALQLDDANRRAERLHTLLQESAEVAAAALELPTALALERGRAEQIETQRLRLTELRDARLHGKDRRITSLRAGTLQIADGAKGAAKLARTLLDQDDGSAAELDDLPTLIGDIEDAIANGDRELQVLARRRQWLERTAARGDEMARALSEREEALAAGRQLLTTRREHLTEAERLEAVTQQHGAALAALVQRTKADALAIALVGDRARMLPRLDAAQARLDELAPQIDGARAELDRIAQDRVELEVLFPPGFVPPPPPNTSEAEHAAKVAESALRSTEATVAVRQAGVAQANARTDRLGELAEQRQRVEGDLADWRLLERDLGRNGVQALELDAAGPELTDLANDLLHHCLGPRFSVRVESTRPSADGKKDLEGCFVFVHDSIENREAEARTFSGGERVLVGEAINLAVTMLAVRHAGMAAPTLIRDETGAALDPEKGRAYIAMLRRAADLVGAHRVLFVSHDPELQEMADSRVRVADGRLEVA